MSVRYANALLAKEDTSLERYIIQRSVGARWFWGTA